MTVTPQKQVRTDEAFMALPEDSDRCELVTGELINMGNSGMEHGYNASILVSYLVACVKTYRIGVVCDSSTAFAIKMGNKRSPNVSFVSKARLQGLKRLPKGFFEGALALAIEVISPNNTFEEIHQKIVEYFENGSRLVWIVNSSEETVTIYHSSRPDRLLGSTDTLDGEDVVPEFLFSVAKLFNELEFRAIVPKLKLSFSWSNLGLAT